MIKKASFLRISYMFLYCYYKTRSAAKRLVGKHKMDLTIMFLCNFYLALQYFVTHHIYNTET